VTGETLFADAKEKGIRKRECIISLSSIIEPLTNKVEEKKFATFLYRFMNCMKKSSTKAVHLASRATGLTIDCTHIAHVKRTITHCSYLLKLSKLEPKP
jgi:hypothetical protein